MSLRGIFALTLVLLAPVAGVGSEALPRRAALMAHLAEVETGVRVQAVLPGGTAAALGLQAGDELLAIDAVRIETVADVLGWAARSAAGRAVSIELRREGRVKTLEGSAVARPMEAAGPVLSGAAEPAYRVEYAHVELADGARLRTLLSVPAGNGPHPALMLIQGVSLASVDVLLSDAHPYAQLLAPFATAGYVTLRVEKPGLGDSEGGPAAALDFQREAAGYRAALAMLRERPEVDPDRVFLFGHSMGGIWAPLLAAELEKPVAGIAVYGSVFRSWNEYDLENARRQFQLGGMSASEIHDALNLRARLNSALLLEGLDPEAARERPGLAAALDEAVLDGQWNGRSVAFWQQLAQLNVPDLWTRARTPVLALHGSADFVAARVDHELLAAAVRAAGQAAQFESVAHSDHSFLAASDEAAAYAAIGKPGGTYSSQAARQLDRWLAPRTGLRDYAEADLSLARLPAGSGSGRSMDASLGDVDGDGDLDLVLAKEFARNVLLRQEDGAFVPVIEAFPAHAEDSEDAVLGDFDGDGDLDVVFPSEDSALNEYHWNDGQGRFQPAPHPLPGQTTSNAGVAGDLDGDGDLDLILSRNTARELVLLNDGRGRFVDASEAWMPERIDVTQDLQLADLDGDGDLDLIAGNEPANGGRNRLYRNLGSRFEDISDSALPAAVEETRKVAVGDADGDGDLDLFFANVSFTAPAEARPRLLFNRGDAHFSAELDALPDAAGSLLDASFVDLDGDGDQDLLLGSIGQGTRWWLDTDGRFVDRSPARAGLQPTLAIVALALPAALGSFESGFDRGDRIWQPWSAAP